jgi:Flp pilus assembly pilin Flp
MLLRRVSTWVAQQENDGEQASATWVEYGLLLALIAVVVVSLISLGSFVSGM